MDVSYEMLKDIVLIQSITIDSLNTEISKLEDALEYGPVHIDKSSSSADMFTALMDKFEEKYDMSYFSVIDIISEMTKNGTT